MPSRASTPPTPKTMKAAVYHGANDLRVETVPVPALAAGDVLVRVTACGLSTSDVRRVQMGLPPAGIVLGDEIAGTVEAVGEVD